MLIWILIIAGVVLLDQVSKRLAVTFLDSEVPFDIIKGVFRFTYVENEGAAFGILGNQRWIFMVVSTVAIILLFVYMWKHRPESRLACTALSFIIGGGIGNMIDRVALGYVIDFFDFCAFPSIWKWVFNVADAFICVGAGLLVLRLIIGIANDAKKAKDVESEQSADNSGDEASSKKNTQNTENEAVAQEPQEDNIPSNNTDGKDDNGEK